MSDAVLRTQVAPLREYRDALSDVMVPIAGLEANDNSTLTPPQQPETRMFELPASVWRAMIACYATFLIALLGATGGAHAAFAIAISTIYVAMFFGTARVMLRHAPPQPGSPLKHRGAILQTASGCLARGEVYGQVLIVPATIAVFGIGICLISAILM
ncbi:hypothetical protein [Sphingomicrobium arenosum]|uniref:hypothetical protein n=1 Tax=Sphingomicrobium arenosum TaxID=2233861 RepID=UPI002240BD72|nr:hypothetical protein [Sphingomicrobium arenosum]